MFLIRVNGYKHSAFNTKESALIQAGMLRDQKVEIEFDSSIHVAHGFNFFGGK